MTYKEQLLDPRWQKKRLEIFQRDEFCCKYCCCSDKTLIVHHTYYEKGLMAWEAKDENLWTLCSECHQEFHSAMPEFHKSIIDSCKLKLRDTFITGCAADLFKSFSNIHDLIYLLWEFKKEEDYVIEVLREMFQKRNEEFRKTLECHE